MIIFLYGKDSYRRHKKFSDLVDEYKKKHDLADLAFFDFAQDNTLQEMRHFIDSESLFTEKKLAVARNVLADSREDVHRLFSDEALIANQNVVVIVEHNKDVVSKRWKFLCEKPVVSQKFEQPIDQKFRTWIKKHAKERNIVFDNTLVEALMDKYQFNRGKRKWSDTWAVHNIIEQLSLLGKEKVTLMDAEKLLSLQSEDAMFDFVDAFWQQRLSRLSDLENLLAQNVEGGLLFFTLVKQCGHLLHISRGTIKHFSKGAHPFYLKKLKQHARNLDKKQLVNLQCRLADLDVYTKTGEMTHEDALTELALSNI